MNTSSARPGRPRGPRPRTGTEPLLTAREVADMTGLPGQTVWRMARRGQIPGVIRAGRQVLFSRVRLERWLAGEAVE